MVMPLILRAPGVWLEVVGWAWLFLPESESATPLSSPRADGYACAHTLTLQVRAAMDVPVLNR